MTYTPPSYATLEANTIYLHNSFGKFAGRYSNPTYMELHLRIQQLKTKYTEAASKNYNFFRTDKRLNQIALITQLNQRVAEGIERKITAEGLDEKTINKLKSEEEKAEKRRDRDTNYEESCNILLGALVHRNWRLIQEYSGIRSGYGVTTAKNCVLKNIFNDLLGLNEKNSLDPLTIKTSCEAFLKYLREVENGKINYTEYSYITNRPDFFGEIQEIIDDEQVKAGSNLMFQRFKLGKFIQSIRPILTSYRAELMNVSEKIKELLAEKLSDEEEMGRDEVIELLKTIGTPRPAVFVFLEKYILQPVEVNQKSLDDFIKDITVRIDIYCRYALIGVYVMSLENCEDKALRAAFYEAIDVRKPQSSSPGNLLDDEEKLFALRGLNSFVESFPDFPGNPDLVGDMGPWNFSNRFKTELLLQKQAIECPEEVQKKEKAEVDPDRACSSSCTM